MDSVWQSATSLCIVAIAAGWLLRVAIRTIQSAMRNDGSSSCGTCSQRQTTTTTNQLVQLSNVPPSDKNG